MRTWYISKSCHPTQKSQINQAEVLSSDLTNDQYRLLELQENLATNPLSGIERKAAAAEVGGIIAKLNEDCQIANGNNSWLDEMAKTTETPYRTLANWWSAFTREAGLELQENPANNPLSGSERKAAAIWK